MMRPGLVSRSAGLRSLPRTYKSNTPPKSVVRSSKNTNTSTLVKQHRRYYAEGAIRLKDAKEGEAPVMISGSVGQLASYFFELAYKMGGDKGVKDFETQLNFISRSSEFREDIWNPITQHPKFTEKDRLDAVFRLLHNELGTSVLFATCLVRLVHQGKATQLTQLRIDFEEVMRAYRRESEVVLTTGNDLTPEMLDFWKKNIQLNFLRPGDNMILTHKVDPEITEGYVVEVQGVLHDFTWKHDRQAKEEAAMKSQGVTTELPISPSSKIDVKLLDDFPLTAWGRHDLSETKQDATPASSSDKSASSSLSPQSNPLTQNIKGADRNLLQRFAGLYDVSVDYGMKINSRLNPQEVLENALNIAKEFVPNMRKLESEWKTGAGKDALDVITREVKAAVKVEWGLEME